MALLLVLLTGKNWVEGWKPEVSGGDSGWLSENCSGRWLVTWAAGGAPAASDEKESIWVPNRPWVRYTHQDRHTTHNIHIHSV